LHRVGDTRLPAPLLGTVSLLTEVDLHAPGVAPGMRRALAFLAVHRRQMAIVWAVMIAAGAVANVRSQPAAPLLPVRAQPVEDSIAVLARGGPPMLSSEVPYTKGVPASRLSRLGAGGDAGATLYLPLLGRLSGSHDPAVLMKWVYAACLGLLMLVLPVVAFEVFGSLLFAFLAPILVLWQFHGTRGMDVYWVETWCLLLCLPPLLLALRWWRSGRRRRTALLLTALALAAGLASSFRSDAGLAVLVDAVAVVFVGDAQRLGLPPFRLGRPSRVTLTRLGIAALLALAYLCPSTFAFALATAYRDGVVHLLPTGAAAPHTPVSDVTLGGLVGLALSRFWLAPMLLAVGLALPRRRRDAAVTAGLVTPALVLGSTSLLVVPETRFALGWLGAWGVLWLLGIGWTLAELGELLRHRRLRRQLSAIRLRPLAAVALVTVIAGAAAAAGVPGSARSADGFYSRRDTPYALASANTVEVAAWRFDGALPRGWQSGAGARLAPDSSVGGWGLFVQARLAPGGAVLTGPSLLLPAGRYVAQASGLVLGGGVELRAADRRDTVLGTSRHWWSQRNVRNLPLTTRFHLHSPARVSLSFHDWAPAPSLSAFALRQVSLLRVLPDAAFYAARAASITPRSALTGDTLRVWPFNGGTPQGVEPQGPNVRNSPIPNGLRVNTTRTPTTYQILVAPITLEAGRYLIDLDGRVSVGGLALELLDASTDAPIASWRFWHGQHFGRGVMAGTVTLKRTRTVRIVLANWSPEPISSLWGLRQLVLQRLS
jgi:hypothetical protein